MAQSSKAFLLSAQLTLCEGSSYGGGGDLHKNNPFS
jgi:hypothetical protein